ncbi:hypothetical protein HUG15_04135 [Salicibibacter cibarius]|uniref:Uncharacterized protein n=1 Tax=Salicibibacter cibarius TaxID=2743000 RepID=A0A7T6Z1A1_9BACI|nr:hypothetical protein [Salicibibacter cibarius]QQK74871.1 hypothetical protein HUG15_04135 [Salicibibacter cibarius]
MNGFIHSNKRPDCFWTEIKTVDEEEVHRIIGGYLPVSRGTTVSLSPKRGGDSSHKGESSDRTNMKSGARNGLPRHGMSCLAQTEA